MATGMKKCRAKKEEQLYILEVFVESVSMYVEKMERIDPTTLGVDLQFVDFPLFRIFHSDFLITKPDRWMEATRAAGFRHINFNAGKMCIFTKNPGKLVDAMRSKPLLLDVYKIKEILLCPEEVIKHPLGNSTIPIPGCLCDQVMMASNDKYHLPQSYTINNTFGLVDEENMPSGFIKLFIRLTCVGKYFKSADLYVQKKLVFRTSGSYNEYICTKVPYPDEADRRKAEEGTKFCLPNQVFEESELDAPPGPVNVAGLVLVCRELCKTDGFPQDLKHPNFPPVILDKEVEERKFRKDRTAEGMAGYIDTTHDDKASIIQRKVFLHQADCINTRCPGNVCTGTK